MVMRKQMQHMAQSKLCLTTLHRSPEEVFFLGSSAVVAVAVATVAAAAAAAAVAAAVVMFFLDLPVGRHNYRSEIIHDHVNDKDRSRTMTIVIHTRTQVDFMQFGTLKMMFMEQVRPAPPPGAPPII